MKNNRLLVLVPFLLLMVSCDDNSNLNSNSTSNSNSTTQPTDSWSNEIKLLMNLVSTIARKRTNVKVFLLGNAISKYSPYSDALNIRLDKLKYGEIITKEFKNDGVVTKFAIERTRNVKISNNNNSFSNFGKINSSMINGGGFEKDNYPRIINGIFFNENYKEIIESGINITKRNCFNKNDKRIK